MSFNAPTDFVPTVVTNKIIEALEYAKTRKSFAVITGSTGRGKTYTAQRWAAQNNATMLRAVSGASRRAFLVQLCAALHVEVSPSASATAMLTRLTGQLTPKDMLIIDEAGFLLPRAGRVACPLEIVRDLYDICAVPVVLIFTDVYLRDLNSGIAADYFEQFKGRIGWQVTIPDRIYSSEIAAICRAYVPDASERMIAGALSTTRKRDGKLRTLFDDLNKAAEFAAAAGRKTTENDFKAAVNWRRLGGVWPEEA